MAHAVKWPIRWAAMSPWSDSICFENCVPVLFRTRREAQEWTEKKYGYIRQRLDLSAAPHHWRLKSPVKVKIEMLRESE